MGSGSATSHPIFTCLHALRGFESRERQEEVVNPPDEDEYLRFLHDNGFAHICDPHGVRGETMSLPQQA